MLLSKYSFYLFILFLVFIFIFCIRTDSIGYCSKQGFAFLVVFVVYNMAIGITSQYVCIFICGI